ncbi:hypothetical protein SNEBB_003163 [Seison nebaliae]|nr:hypothetical protein SNEBB_003163 [Seison nebaliae]
MLQCFDFESYYHRVNKTIVTNKNDLRAIRKNLEKNYHNSVCWIKPKESSCFVRFTKLSWRFGCFQSTDDCRRNDTYCCGEKLCNLNDELFPNLFSVNESDHQPIFGENEWKWFESSTFFLATTLTIFIILFIVSLYKYWRLYWSYKQLKKTVNFRRSRLVFASRERKTSSSQLSLKFSSPISCNSSMFKSDGSTSPLIGNGGKKKNLMKTIFDKLKSFSLIRRESQKKRNEERELPLMTCTKPCTGSDETDIGSGGGKLLLKNRDLRSELKLFNQIGYGRYGVVVRGRLRDEDVAVKLFMTKDEESWKHETNIYNECKINHNNIISYIASDMVDTLNGPQYIIILEYHQCGDLRSYLNELLASHKTVDYSTVLSLLYTASLGLKYLHTTIDSIYGKKALLHGDINLSNILVKVPGVACLTDFGMSIYYSSEKSYFKSLIASTTIGRGSYRYMAPEFLDRKFSFKHYKNLFASDVYSFSLVMWALGRCCEKDVECVEDPFSSFTNPTQSTMYEVVVLKGERPDFLEHVWKGELKRLKDLIIDSWHTNSDDRLTSLRISKNLCWLKEQLEERC